MVRQFHEHHADTLIQADLTHISALGIKADGRALGSERPGRDGELCVCVWGGINKSDGLSKFGNFIASTSKHSSQNPT